MKISYSAPAKVILSGEHAVVYGNPALVSAIDLRLKFSLWEKKFKIKDKNILYISQKIKKYLKNRKIIFTDKSFSYSIESEIPIGRGLGSSAALSVASTAAFLEFYTGRQFKKETINNLAYQIEKHFHNNPSGADNSTVCFGGLIFYKKESEDIKNIRNLNFIIPKKIETKLLLIDSGKPKEKTSEMVSLVAKLCNKTPKIFRKILIGIENITNQLISSIIKEDKNLFKKSLFDNEKMLEELGVVSEKTKILLKNLSKFGFGKITGAGGRKANSGFILFLAEDKKELEKYLKQKRINYYQFVQDYQGLKKYES